MKRGILNSIFIAILLIIINACNENATDYYSLADIYISMGLVETTSPDGNDFVIYCDNGDTLLPAVNVVNNFETRNDQRVIVNYTVLDEVGNSAHKYYVRINNLQEVLFKDPIELTDANSDSLGTDPIQIKDIWIAKNMLNIDFRYKGDNKTHFVNLCYKTNQEGMIERPVELEFRHNANNDDELLVLDGIVTFKLDTLLPERTDFGSSIVEFVVKSTNYQDEEQTYTGIYEGN